MLEIKVYKMVIVVRKILQGIDRATVKLALGCQKKLEHATTPQIELSKPFISHTFSAV